MQVIGVVMKVLLFGKLDSSSSEATLLSVFLLAAGFGLATALCRATTVTCEYSLYCMLFHRCHHYVDEENKTFV